MFDDDDLDISSGSDFDDDEDPDKIEVPGMHQNVNPQISTKNLHVATFFFSGGGRDLATAVSFAKQSNLNSSLSTNNQSNSSVKVPTTFDVATNPVAATSNQLHPTLKHLIPAESILKPFLPKVNTASTRVHPPSTTTNITAASNAAMSYSSATGYGTTGLKAQTTVPQGKITF